MVEATSSTITASFKSRVSPAEVVGELNQIIKLLEAKLPANLDRDENIKLEKQMQCSMGAYFKDLENALPMDKLEELYYRFVEQE